MIELRNIGKRFGSTQVLRDLSLALEPGQSCLLLGPNGAGKTTALNIAAGILAEDSGEVLIGQERVSAKQRRVRTAYLPQGVAFQPRLECRAILRFYARALNAPREQIDAALDRWGLQEHACKRTRDLSGGLRQRLGLAVLSLSSCPVLLLDEPGLSLDAHWRHAMQEWIRDEAESGKTILVATHLVGEWAGKAHRCLRCVDGSIADEVDPQDLRELAEFPNEGEEAKDPPKPNPEEARQAK